MKIKELINRILFYVSVPKCVYCGEKLNYQDKALCAACLEEYNNQKHKNCSLCSKTYSKCTCTNQYLSKHYVTKLIKVYRYMPAENFPSNALIYNLKRVARNDTLEFLTDELKFSIESNIKNVSECIFINVPRRKSSIAKYGFDHAELLAKSLAKQFSAEYYQPIISKAKHDQKKMHGPDRIKNVQFAYKRNAKDLKGKTVILVDDIVTTGASMGAMAMLLRGLGTKSIIGASISIAYKDMYKKFQKGDRFKPYKI